MNIPRPEHPNPQWERKNWQNLNGEWEFEFDFGCTAINRNRFEAEKLDGKITVPFCPESELSGIGYKDFINAVCYKRNFEITKEQLCGRVILHFGAVDYKCTLYINGKTAGEHIGGFSSFEFDITKYLHEGDNSLFLHVTDDHRTGLQGSGKQSSEYDSHGCFYTRSTGIWQTVWLEFVPEKYIKSAKYYPDTDNQSVTIIGETEGCGIVEATSCIDGKEVGKAVAKSGGHFVLTVELSEKLVWEVGKGGLYDLELKFGNDSVKSYFGLRDIAIDGYKVFINGESVFQRLVLDQGFYPDGIYTAPTKEALLNDIMISLNAGFNGARLHQKVFEPLFLYYADKLGYIVWGEYANWGIDYSEPAAAVNFINEWSDVLKRDFNHPAIVGWCPFNETWNYVEKYVCGMENAVSNRLRAKAKSSRILETAYRITKLYDSTRPCIDTSGNFHVITDIYDIHDYEQNPVKFAEIFKMFNEKGEFDMSGFKPDEYPYFYCTYEYQKGMPAFVSEYGGIKWDVSCLGAKTDDCKSSWGYGQAPMSEEEFISRYKGLTEVLLFNKNMFGFCYTQLYDVEQERNGLYTYDRKPKFDMEIFRKINSQKAAIE